MDINKLLNLKQTGTSIKKKMGILFMEILINTAIMVAGVFAVVFFMMFMQREYTLKKDHNLASETLNMVVETLEANTEKVGDLIDAYHSDNLTVVQDTAKLIANENYADLYLTNLADQISCLKILSEAIGNEGFLIGIDGSGKILYAPEVEYVGKNMVEDGTLSMEQIGSLTTYGTREYQFSEVLDMYFYGAKVRDDEYLIYGVPREQLEKQFSALSSLNPILSMVSIGDRDVIMVYDPHKEEISYHVASGNVFKEKDALEKMKAYPELLENGYHGIQYFDEEEYYCYSRSYSSKVYGEDLTVIVANSVKDIYDQEVPAVIFTVIGFLTVAIICLMYTSMMMIDPEQIVGYDENLITLGESKKKRRRKKTDTKIRNIKVFKLFGKQFYFKLGIAEKLTPVIAIGLAALFIISWNSQTLVELSRNIRNAGHSVDHLETLFKINEENAETVKNRYEQQYLYKLRLTSYLAESDPSFFSGREQNLPGADVIYTYLDENFEPMHDSEGNLIRCVSNSTALSQAAERNGMDALYIFDDHGHMIASSTNLWNFTLSQNPEEQSYPFRDIVSGVIPDYIQEIKTDEGGDVMQYIGTTLYYTTLRGEGKDNGRYMPKSAYDRYIADGEFIYDGESYEVVFHRGMIQAGIKDSTIAEIVESTTPEYILKHFKFGNDGEVQLFDNTAEHVCQWSSDKVDIGKTAEELNFADNAFYGDYKGFVRHNGVRYFRMVSYDNGYWVSIWTPENRIFRGRTEIATVTIIVCGIFFLLMYAVCILTSQEEEDALQAIIERRVKREEDPFLINVTMPNGKIKYIRPAKSRFDMYKLEWKDMSVSQKMIRFFRLLLLAAGIAGTCVIVFGREIFGANSALSYVLYGDWDKSVNYFAVLACLIMVTMVYVISKLISLFISFVIRNMGNRIETIGRLLLSVIRYGAVLFSIFFGLSMLGASPKGLITSAGIMSLVIGLGAQSLISDILSGIFIVFEGAFRVGDIVMIDGFHGIVVDIGIRTTKVEDIVDNPGNIRIFNNSSFTTITNMTKKDSFVLSKVSIAYGEDLQKVEEIIKAHFPAIRKKFPQFTEDLVYMGVYELGDSEVVIGVGCYCDEMNRLPMGRALTRELYLILKENHIEIPFPQRVVSFAADEKKAVEEETAGEEE